MYIIYALDMILHITSSENRLELKLTHNPWEMIPNVQLLAKGRNKSEQNK